MHEYSILQSLVERVEEEQARRRATSIHAIHLRVGELSGVETELLDALKDMLDLSSSRVGFQNDDHGLVIRERGVACRD